MSADQKFHSNAVLIGHMLHMCFPALCLLYELHICLDPQIVVFFKKKYFAIILICVSVVLGRSTELCAVPGSLLIT